MTKTRVLVVIPAFNEEKSITDVLLKLRAVAPDFDVIIVNDGSRDKTEQAIRELGEKQLRLTTNLGYGLALQTGMKYALQRGYEIVVCLDADGQHRPEDAPALVKALLDGNADMVIGSRFYSGGSYDTPIDRRLGQLLFSHLTRLLVGQRIYDTSSGFKALRAVTCENMIHMTFMDFHVEMIVRLSMAGYKIIEHPIIMHKRTAGRSMHSYVSIFSYPVKTLVLTLVTAFDMLLARRSR
jgi:glycosyltransferase involved in cell wall biosynthesis